MTLTNHEEVAFLFCDYTQEEHCCQLAELINQYISDPMGGGAPLSKLQQLRLVDGLANHPASFVLFITNNQQIAGLATCFINFSTFKARSYINIHDLIIANDYRGKGLGRKLLQAVENIARERRYCKITLEVRDDNQTAMKLYSSQGFAETKPNMYFRTKELD